MPQSETIDQFYQQPGNPQASGMDYHVTAAGMGSFNVYDQRQFCNRRMSYSRRDFFNIFLMTGTGRLNYASRGVLLDRPALVFSNPLVPFS